VYVGCRVEFEALPPIKRATARSAEAFHTKTPEELYGETTKRVQHAIRFKESERVPFLPFFISFPARYAGVTFQEAMQDLEKRAAAWKKAILHFEPDGYNAFVIVALGLTLDMCYVYRIPVKLLAPTEKLVSFTWHAAPSQPHGRQASP
jgi:hypothetical protein